MARTVAVVGTGMIGSRVAARLAGGGVDLVVAAGSLESAQAAAGKIGHGVKAAETDDAIAQADTVIFATRFDVTKQLLPELGEKLSDKIVVDPSNNIMFENGKARP